MLQATFEAYFLAIKLISIYMLGMFAISLIKKDNSIVDTAYGIGFVLIAVSTFFVYSQRGFVQILVTTLIVIWGMRLSLRIYLRNRNKPEDFRYKKWREEWKWFKTRSFFQVYVLQGLIIISISSVSIVANSQSIGDVVSIGMAKIALISLGLLTWIVGFIFETVGDYELDQFIEKQVQDKAEASIRGEQYKPVVTVMTQGLWSYTRHPNYFGEVAMWWGLWFIVCAIPLGYFAILSPIVITYLLLKVSGIPMLEEKYKDNPEYEAYKLRTNAFFPWK